MRLRASVDRHTCLAGARRDSKQTPGCAPRKPDATSSSSLSQRPARARISAARPLSPLQARTRSQRSPRAPRAVGSRRRASRAPAAQGQRAAAPTATMFRSQYDTDVTVWSPQGRLLQVEYAMEAVKQGSACLGLVGKDGVVLAALKRQPNELSGHQKKLLKIDDHLVLTQRDFRTFPNFKLRRRRRRDAPPPRQPRRGRQRVYTSRELRETVARRRPCHTGDRCCWFKCRREDSGESHAHGVFEP
jgi:hypothetical protein